jgi:hypothetical protein
MPPLGGLFDRRFQPHLYEMQHLPIADATRNALHQFEVRDTIEGTYDTLPVISTSPRTSRLSALAIRSKADRSTCSVRCIGKVGYFSF